jgi:hypothetical protein
MASETRRMKFLHRLRFIALLLACLSMLIPKTCLGATPPATNLKSPITDISLQEGRTLRGQVLDSDGIPQADIPVTVSYQSNSVAETSTNRQGEFTVTGLRGGVHLVTTSQGVAACRFWAPETSPPNAKTHLLVIGEQMVVRGQPRARHAIAHMLSNPWLIGGIAAIAIAVPVAINANDDDDSGS